MATEDVIIPERDDKNVITDIAFGVDKSLLGKPIATPTQRGIAILVDAFLVLLLTDVSPLFWAFFAGIAFFKAGKKQKNKSWRITRFFLRFAGAITIFVATLALVDKFFQPNFSDWQQSTPSFTTDAEVNGSNLGLGLKNIIGATVFTTQLIELSKSIESNPDCDINCFTESVDEITNAMAATGIDKESAADILTESLDLSLFDSEQHKQIQIQQLLQQYKTETDDNDETLSQAMNTDSSADTDNENESTVLDNQTSEQSDDLSDLEPEEQQPVYSLVEYIKALIADLGLGFGWAALYFTAFSAWWRGQTPGKRLMGIRVIQLDGTYMSAWDSFGRYGGYGAGFATGLMGFLQIFWDANRQAIQDKISATVVIKGDL